MALCIRTSTAVLISFFCGLTFAAGEQSAIKLSPQGCQSYAAWSGNLVWASDLGADKEKARADLIASDEKTPFSIFALLLRNLDSLWSTSAKWEQVTVLLLTDCVQRQGIYSAE